MESLENFFALLDKTLKSKSKHFGIQSTVMLMKTLEDVIMQPQKDPEIALEDSFAVQVAFLQSVLDLEEHLVEVHQNKNKADKDHTEELFEEAWTTFSKETFMHSVNLVESRLRDSGFDEAFFDGKTCFDGGCGIGRLSVAMSRLGASKVIAADIGGSSLSYFEHALFELEIKNVEIVNADITDLSKWEAGSFDFVATNGVLHHTLAPIEGLKEHYRITSDQSGVLWIYLYGDRGNYWPIYDRIRDSLSEIDTKFIKEVLTQMNLREGLVSTYLDNCLAPRTYHLTSDIVKTLNDIHPMTFKEADGPSIFDKPTRYIGEKYGSWILGPEGEVRIVIEKKPN
ncbi:class I SAM-dependent methyltransferase [Verrucomicrobia bacterium]|nr:class I SAM-dependent methyltransferase [Verrucomicrobiota bacterium]